LTFFDSAGPHGLRSRHGVPLPACDLLAAFAARAGRPTSAVSSDDPAAVCAIAVDGDDPAVLIANCTPRRQTVRLDGPALSETTLRRRSYLLGPGGGTSPPVAAEPAPGPLVLELAAYEVVLLEGRKDDE